MMEFGQGTNSVLETEKIYAGKNVVVNDRLFAIGVYKKGEIVANKKVFSAAGSVQVGGNTGNATIGTVSAGAQIKEGTYNIICTAATKAGVYAPSGEYLGEATFGTAFVNAQVVFTITAGATPCIAGDGFRVIVTVTADHYCTFVPANFDGSQIPSAICAKDITLVAPGYAPIAFGEFQKSGVQEIMTALTAPISITAEFIAQLDKVGCYLKDV